MDEALRVVAGAVVDPRGLLLVSKRAAPARCGAL